MANHSGSSPLAEGLMQLGTALAVSAADFMTRSIEIGTRYASEAFTPAIGEWRHALAELALLPGLAVERFASELAYPQRDSRERMRPAARMVDGRPFSVPASIRDAAQGLALYAVPAAVAQEALGGVRAPFRVIDIGRGRTAFQLFASDYRDSDFGICHELGAAFFVAPRAGLGGMGMFVIDLPVSERFACDAGKQVWGFAKRVVSLDFEYAKGEATCTLRRKGGGAPIAAVTFARGGTGASTNVPMPSYTLLGGRLHRTTFVRTGRGERLQAGGNVALVLDDAAVRRGDRLAVLLHDLGLAAATPMLTGWTEHMSGEFGFPMPVA